MDVKSNGLTIYVASGLGGGFSPTHALVAANCWEEAIQIATDRVPHFLVLAAASLSSVSPGNLDFNGEWRENFDAPTGPRVLAEYYA